MREAVRKRERERERECEREKKKERERDTERDKKSDAKSMEKGTGVAPSWIGVPLPSVRPAALTVVSVLGQAEQMAAHSLGV